MKRIPIKAAKDYAVKYGQDQVIILSFERETGVTHCVTYGKTLQDCNEACDGGNKLKKVLGWPDELCTIKPKRRK